jgi:hypothetical protein
MAVAKSASAQKQIYRIFPIILLSEYGPDGSGGMPYFSTAMCEGFYGSTKIIERWQVRDNCMNDRCFNMKING